MPHGEELRQITALHKDIECAVHSVHDTSTSHKYSTLLRLLTEFNYTV